MIGSDRFHDGKMVLRDVLDWHEYLRSGIRKNDMITERVLDLVEKRLLVDRDIRISTKDLCEELQQISKTAKHHMRQPTPQQENIRATLKEMEARWTTISPMPPTEPYIGGTKHNQQPMLRVRLPHESQHNRITHRTRFPAPLQTSHRSKTPGKSSSDLKAPSRAVTESSHHAVADLQDAVGTRSMQMDTVERHVSKPSLPITGTGKSPLSSPPTRTSTYSSTIVRATKHTRGLSLRDKMPKMFSKKEKGDEVLLRHYNNRDIVSRSFISQVIGWTFKVN